MTGAQVVSVLEEQCQPAGGSRPFLFPGVSDGFTYTLDRTVENAVCTEVEVTNVALDGVALDPAATHRVTVNNFLVDGGDNFATFAEVDPSLRVGGGDDPGRVHRLPRGVRTGRTARHRPRHRAVPRRLTRRLLRRRT